MIKKSTRRKIFGSSFVVFATLLSTIAHGQDILVEIDLTVENEVTLRATTGNSIASATGDVFTGIYFDQFFAGAAALTTNNINGDPGDFTSAENPSDGTPQIFRAGTDPGLNIWTFSTDVDATFTQDSLAFVGTYTQTLDPLDYQAHLTAPPGGDIYFPADTEDDIPAATLLGTYEVIFPVVSGGFVPPASFTVFRGLTISAAASDFTDSDDVSASFNPGFTISSLEAPVWLIFDANAAAATSFQVESNAGTPGLTYTVEAFNWANGAYDEIGVTVEAFNTDAVMTFPVVAADHIDTGGEVRGRVGWRRTGFTINFPWEVRVDQVGWNQ